MNTTPRIAHVFLLSSLAVLLLAACGGGETVETVLPRRGPIEESFSEPSKTRLEKTWPVSMHVTARVARIDLEPGDKVRKGQTLVEVDLEPLRLDVARTSASVAALDAQLVVKDDNRLENSALEELLATVRAVEEAVKAAGTRVDAEDARHAHARRNLERIRKLVASQTVSDDRLDDAQLNEETALTSLREQQFTLAATRAMLAAVSVGPRAVEQYIARKTLERRNLEEQRAEAIARYWQARHAFAIAPVAAPIDGVVLERREQGDTLLQAGAPLLLLGDLAQLETETEVLSEDALRLTVGSPVRFESASGHLVVTGRVRRIEPFGFTKLSSLGVEQQRVRVQASLDTLPPALGVAYRLRGTFVTGSKQNALVVPRETVLQRPDATFYVFVVEKDRLLERTVALGLQSDLELEIRSGLKEDEQIVARPGTRLRPGMEVRPRPASANGASE